MDVDQRGACLEGGVSGFDLLADRDRYCGVVLLARDRSSDGGGDDAGLLPALHRICIHEPGVDDWVRDPRDSGFGIASRFEELRRMLPKDRRLGSPSTMADPRADDTLGVYPAPGRASLGGLTRIGRWRRPFHTLALPLLKPKFPAQRLVVRLALVVIIRRWRRWWWWRRWWRRRWWRCRRAVATRIRRSDLLVHPRRPRTRAGPCAPAVLRVEVQRDACSADDVRDLSDGLSTTISQIAFDLDFDWRRGRREGHIDQQVRTRVVHIEVEAGDLSVANGVRRLDQHGRTWQD